MRIPPNSNASHCCKVVKNNLNPEWNATFSLDTEFGDGLLALLEPECLELTLRLFDSDLVDKDTELGVVNVPLVKTASGEWEQQSLPLDTQGTVDIAFCRMDKPITENVTEKKVM